MAEQSYGQGTPLVITELTGDRRSITLTGRALPYQPLVFSGTMRLESTWYPGNPIATTQVFGAAEDETSMKGMWKNRFLKEFENGDAQIYTAGAKISTDFNSFQVADVSELAKIVDDVRRKGQIVEVTWDEIIRRGFLQKFVQTWKSRQDLEWEIVFSWVSQGDEPSPAAFTGQMDLGQIQASWNNMVGGLRKAVGLEKVAQLRGDIANKIAELGNKISDLADQITDTIALLVAVANTPAAVVGRLMAIYSNLVDTADQLLSVVKSVGAYSQMFDFGSDEPDYGEQLQTQAYGEGIRRQTEEIRRQALEQQADMLKNLNPNLLGTYIAKAGDNLRDISVAFFKTPDHWRDLMAFNSITNSELSAGQIILIPKTFEALQ